MKRILILSANPHSTTRLRVDEEMREIKEGLRRSKQREDFVIETAQAVRYRDIRRAILDFEPNIVHFSGHGGGEDGLVFEDETGQVKLVESEALARLFALFAAQIECVVLNACYSEVQASAIAKHIPYVVGMNKAIGDRAAIEFAVGFYDGLGAGRAVEFAYKLGCNSIEVAGIPEHLTPQLLSKVNVFDLSSSSPAQVNQKTAQPMEDNPKDIITNSDNSRLQSLQRRKKQLEEQVAYWEKLSNDCSQQIQGEGDLDKISQLNAKIDNYSVKIEEIYDTIDEVEQKISKIQTS